ncbi:MAG: HAMP domain-containing sensor histidine kinase [Immundisolibacteraceae bacterium]|nr:HAMP domain-containing sensor histidine kinase [Immundisolibacteraceae bacterium]
MLPKATLIRLLQLRSFAILGQLLAILIVHLGLDLELPLAANLSVISLLVLINGLFWRQIRTVGDAPQRLVFVHLLVDIAGLTLLLYLNGGYSNPFSALYLLPLALAATLLSSVQVWALTGMAAVGYSLNLFFYIPLPHYHGILGDQFHLHLLGMWLGFIIGAAVIAYFLVSMSRELRRRERALNDAMAVAGKREQLAALGVMAASTAHDLGTPLSTVQMLVEELLEPTEGEPTRARENLQLIKSQVERCNNALRELRFGANRGLLSGDDAIDVEGPVDPVAELESLIDEWSLMSPGLQVEFKPDQDSLPSSPACHRLPAVAVDTLRRGLVAMLDNALDAQADRVAVEYRCSDDTLLLRLTDNGEGVAGHVIESLGEPYLTTRGEGRGLGLYLIAYLVDRLGGSIRVARRAQRGSVAEILLPVHSLRPTGEQQHGR